jgi:hypothetical protein
MAGIRHFFHDFIAHRFRYKKIIHKIFLLQTPSALYLKKKPVGAQKRLSNLIFPATPLEKPE